jgi:4,5-DOPA dioxygenase extradiol
MITKTNVQTDLEWGLDHGTWSFLLPMYPKADIPVFQLSLDYYKPMDYHYALAKQLAGLRKKGVLVVGSGNIVHNLRMLNFSGETHNWAIEFDQKIKEFITDNNHQGIIQYEKTGSLSKLAVPTHDHYLPLIYSIALQKNKEEISFFNEKIDMGAVSMRSFKIG